MNIACYVSFKKFFKKFKDPGSIKLSFFLKQHIGFTVLMSLFSKYLLYGSIGATVVEMLTGYPPWHECDTLGLINTIMLVITINCYMLKTI